MAKKTNKRGFVSTIRRFVGNKNTVTILGVAASIAVLIVGYNYRVRVAINPLQIPYAKQTIEARTLITNDMVGRIKISSTYTTDATNLVKNIDDVVNKYASYKTNIPKGSLFFTDQLISAEEMPDSAFANIEDGYTIYSLEVNIKTTYGNSIRAGEYIDLYMRATENNNENKVIFGKMIESIRVLAVKDSQGNNILDNSANNGTPSELVFAVKDEMYVLLMESKYVKGNIEIIPVPRNANYTQNANETQVSSEQLTSYITDQVEILQG